MANNKVQLSDGTVLLDLTGDTVTAGALLSGVTAHNAAGVQITGTMSGASASIKVTGPKSTDTVTATDGTTTKTGVWTTDPNPDLRNLPTGYTQLEYIESSGTQYIDTGFKPNQNSRATCDFQYVSTTEEQTIFMARTSASANMFGVFHNKEGWIYGYGTNKVAGSSIAITERISLDCNKNTATFNGQAITVTAETFSASVNLMLFVRNTNGKLSNYAIAKIFACQIYDNEEKIRDFVPCKNASGTVGLYDLVTSTFYANAGTGTFTAGAEVPATIGYWLISDVSNGTWMVTATGSSGTETKAVTVSTVFELEMSASASTSATPGVTYTSGLSGLDAATVALFAEAISNNSAITRTTSVVYCDYYNLHRKISVGDQVALSLNGTSYNFDVIGFNHDTLTNAEAYGSSTETGKAGFTFQMHDLLATTYSMNSPGTNSGGWKSCQMRTSTMATMKGYLPSAWRSAIKPVNKASGTGGGSTSGTETVSDSCFLLAEIEIFGSTSTAVSGEGSQYAYYKAGNTKVKKRSGSADQWWDRSPASGSSYGFAYVTASGTINTYDTDADYSRGVAFAFCV